MKKVRIWPTGLSQLECLGQQRSANSRSLFHSTLFSVWCCFLQHNFLFHVLWFKISEIQFNFQNFKVKKLLTFFYWNASVLFTFSIRCLFMNWNKFIEVKICVGMEQQALQNLHINMAVRLPECLYQIISCLDNKKANESNIPHSKPQL